MKYTEPQRVRPLSKTPIVFIVLIDLIKRKKKRAYAHLFSPFEIIFKGKKRAYAHLFPPFEIALRERIISNAVKRVRRWGL